MLYVSIAGVFTDPFGLNWGYSSFWLILMFILGALLKKNNFVEKISKKKLFVLLIPVAFLSVSSQYIIAYLSKSLLGRSLGDRIFTDYTSPTMVFVSVALVLLFSYLNIKGFVEKLVLFFSPAAFGIYIIHFHPFISTLFIKNKLSCLLDYNSFIKIGVCLIFGLCVCLICMLIEKILLLIIQVTKIFFILLKKKSSG